MESAIETSVDFCRFERGLTVLRKDTFPLVVSDMPITVATDEPSPEDAPEPTPASTPPAVIIEVEFAVARLRITGSADPALGGTVIAALPGQSA